MSSFAEQLRGTIAIDLQGSNEFIGPTFDQWQPLSFEQREAHRAALRFPSALDTDVVRSFEIMPEQLVTKGLTPEQNYLRSWLICDAQNKLLNDPNNPFPTVHLFQTHWRYHPVVIRRSSSQDDETGIWTTRTYFHRNPHAPSGDGAWAYVNKIYSQVNEVLEPSGNPTILLHSSYMQYEEEEVEDNLDDTVPYRWEAEAA